MIDFTKVYLSPNEQSPIKQNSVIRQLVEVEGRSVLQSISTGIATFAGSTALNADSVDMSYSYTDTFSTGNHSTSAVASLGVYSGPVGSGANGANHGDIGINVYMDKQNFLSTSAISGEMDGLQIYSRQGGPDGGGSDTSGILLNIQSVGSAGFINACEWDVSRINRGSVTIDLQDHGAFGSLNGALGLSYGYSLTPMVGTITYGYHVEPNSTSAGHTYPFDFGGGASPGPFHVDSNGGVTCAYDVLTPIAITNLPSASGNSGLRYMVTGANTGASFATTITSGNFAGATPVWSDGTNWRFG